MKRQATLLMTLSAMGICGLLVAGEKSTAGKGGAGPAAFEKLKALNGEWRGTVQSKDGPPATVTYRTTSNGSAVLEDLFPGTSHEMITIYHLDGDALVLTHYCAMGNQPRMSLTTSDAGELVFDFAGGANLKPDVDTHMHSARINLRDADHLESEWVVYQSGRRLDSKKFFLERYKP
ncbi:MAG TPA: hypothetical protein VN461_05045 [Vicinamibacteria bacterium]|jgi:hypothetical protein|nr:hypothetical protein [Vicinamibacteria bacterium]